MKSLNFKGKKIDAVLVFLIFSVLVNGLFLYLMQGEKRVYFEAKEKLALASKTNGGAKALLAKTKILDQVFPKEPGVINFIRSVEEKGGWFDALSLSFINDEPQVEGGAYYLPFSLEISGERNRVLSFVSAILNAPYVISIETYNLSSEDGFRSQAAAVVLGKIYVSENYSQ